MRLCKALIPMAVLIMSSAQAGAWADYENLRKDIISERLTPQSLELARQLWPANTELHDALKSAYALYGNNYYRTNRSLMQSRHRDAYTEFIEAPPIAEVLYEFLTEQEETVETAANGNRSPGSVMAWKSAYIAQAAVYGYQATKDNRFIDIVLRHGQKAYKFTDQERGIKDEFGRDNVTGWSLFDRGKYGREITLPGRIISPLLELRLLVDADPALKQRYGAEVKALSDKGINILAEYLPFVIKEGNQQYFTYLWTGEHDALNHMAAYAQAAAFAYKVSGDTRFRDFGVGFRNYFVANAVQNSDLSWTWPYQVKPDAPAEAYWKGAITTTGLYRMHQAGIAMPRNAQVGMVRAFTNNVILKPFYNVNVYIDPKRPFQITGYNANSYGGVLGALFTNYVLLDDFVPVVRKDIVTTVANRPDLFPQGFLAESSDAESYAWMLWQDSKK